MNLDGIDVFLFGAGFLVIGGEERIAAVESIGAIIVGEAEDDFTLPLGEKIHEAFFCIGWNGFFGKFKGFQPLDIDFDCTAFLFIPDDEEKAVYGGVVFEAAGRMDLFVTVSAFVDVDIAELLFFPQGFPN